MRELPFAERETIRTQFYRLAGDAMKSPWQIFGPTVKESWNLVLGERQFPTVGVERSPMFCPQRGQENGRFDGVVAGDLILKELANA